MQTRLTERTIVVDAKVDKEAGVIRGVRVVNRTSSKKRDYSDRSLDDIARLSEGARVFNQHNSKSPWDRPVTEQFGVLRNAKRDPSGVSADFHVSSREGWILEDAVRMPDSFMLSINALGSTRRVGGRLLVESIPKLASVDMVPAGGTTTSLFESQSEEDDSVDMKQVTLATLREERPDLLQEHASEVIKVTEAEGEQGKKIATLETNVNALTESNKALEVKLDGYKAAEAVKAKKDKVTKVLSESKLPKEAVTDTFIKLLEMMDEDKDITAAIEDRKMLVESASNPNRITGGPRGSDEDKTEGDGYDLKGLKESLAV
jgi:hypothetical protein